jgi:hypothetical protein
VGRIAVVVVDDRTVVVVVVVAVGAVPIVIVVDTDNALWLPAESIWSAVSVCAPVVIDSVVTIQ